MRVMFVPTKLRNKDIFKKFKTAHVYKKLILISVLTSTVNFNYR